MASLLVEPTWRRRAAVVCLWFSLTITHTGIGNTKEPETGFQTLPSGGAGPGPEQPKREMDDLLLCWEVESHLSLSPSFLAETFDVF